MIAMEVEHNISEILEKDLQRIDKLKREVFFQEKKETSPLISTFLEFVFNKQGKNLRPKLALLSSKAQGETNRATYLSAILIDILHEATLLHDDVVDAAQLRRGETSANVVFGNKATVLMGDYLLSKMIEVCTKEKEFKLLEIISTTLVSLSKGELIQLNATKESEFSVAQLTKVAALKTGSLLKASCLAGAYSAGLQEEDEQVWVDFAENLGIAYQIKDDIIDYVENGKEQFKDIKEGKVNIPMALALESADKETAAHILGLIKDKENFKANIVEITTFLNTQNGVQLAENLQDKFTEKAVVELHKMNNSEDLIAFTEKIAKRTF
ncbi:polyprenyl synthetase family protein [Flavobacteriales bacterium]|jgi:octaprenyl-diphosphate synthase|nr:polyprenyl synthetase family protein [Flavobacteriales bacterium]